MSGQGRNRSNVHNGNDNRNNKGIVGDGSHNTVNSGRNTEMFRGASGFSINDAEFNNVGGNLYNGGTQNLNQNHGTHVGNANVGNGQENGGGNYKLNEGRNDANAGAGPIPTKNEVPKIPAWLSYCDKHPDRRGEDFSEHAGKFNAEGYRRINQLTGDRMSVEKLSNWLNIGKGTADLLIQYAGEDMELIKAGAFSMDLANGSDGEQCSWI